MTEIPKVIHQIWIGTKSKPHYWSDTWDISFVKNYPEYKYVLWTDEKAQEELKKYPILELIFNNIQGYCYKADILRYIILYEYGGIYIDIDSIWNYNNNFDEIILNSINKDNLFVCRSPNRDINSIYYLTNNVIGCDKHNKHMKLLLDSIQMLIYNYNTRKYDSKLLKKKTIASSKIVGPGLVTRLLKNKNINILPSYIFNPLSWHDIDMSNIKMDTYKKSIMIHGGLTTNDFSDKSKNIFCNCNIKIYWINLDRCINRQNHMYFLFGTHLILNSRICAYDGNQIQQYTNIHFPNTNKHISNYEYCCTFSHFKAIKTAYDNNDDIAIIAEDDLCLDYSKKWVHNIDKLINNAPNDWDILKLHCNYEKHINKLIKRHNSQKNKSFFSKWEFRSSSALIYIINKNGMKKIMDEYFIHNKWTLDDDILSKTEYAIFDLANTYEYMIPFANHLVNDSNINDNHIDVHIEGNKTIQKYFNSIPELK